MVSNLFSFLYFLVSIKKAIKYINFVSSNSKLTLTRKDNDRYFFMSTQVTSCGSFSFFCILICKMRIYSTNHGQTISEVLSVFFPPLTHFFLSSCKKNKDISWNHCWMESGKISILIYLFVFFKMKTKQLSLLICWQ